jgi:hypothetical protein
VEPSATVQLARPRPGHFDVAACLREVRGRGAVPVAVAALLSLSQASRASPRVPFYAAATVPSRAWPAGQCPLCASGSPVTDPSSGA